MAHQTVQTEAEPRETKRADALVVGDWLNDDFFGTGPLRIVAPVFTSGGWAHLVYLEHGDPEPGAANIEQGRELRLATPDEIARQESDAHRDTFIRDLRKFADWFEERPWLPVPYSRRSQAQFVNEDDAGMLAEAKELAAQLGVEPEITDDAVTLRAHVGSLELVIFNNRPSAADPLAYSREVDPEVTGAPIPASVSGVPLGHHGPNQT